MEIDLNQYLDLEWVLTQVLAFIPNLLVAGVVFVGFYIFNRLSSSPLRSILERASFEAPLITLLVNRIYSPLVIGFGAVMAVSQLGINVGAALAGISIAGIAISFAAQDTLRNLISGFMIFWDKPFKVGDYVVVLDHYGVVQDITLRTTRIRTLDNTYIVMPNKTIIDEVLINKSKHGMMRLQIPIGIAYGESIQEARDILLATVRSYDGVLKNPVPDIVVANLGASSVDLSVRVWIKNPANEIPVYTELLERCKLALDDANIEIPYPHRQIFVNWDDRPQKLN